MKALRLEGVSVKEIEIENDLKAIQESIGGHFETVRLIDDAVLLVDEEGLLKGLSINVIASCITHRHIVGPALAVGVDGEEFCDLPDDVCTRIKVRWV